MYLDAKGETGDRSVTGHLASGVPGSVAGLWAAHQKLGSKPWAALIAPAIRLAEEGFEVDDYAAGVITAEAERLRRFPASAALYTPGGQPLARGARLGIPNSPALFERIADGGRDGFYKGETASLLLAEMKRGKGIITAADLDGYEPKWRTPITFQYRGHDIISMPPPSSGGITLALIAQQLSAYDLAGLGWHSAPSVHLMAESMRRAFAVRNEVIADPDFVTFDQAELLSPAFSEGLRRTISTERATPSSRGDGPARTRREPPDDALLGGRWRRQCGRAHDHDQRLVRVRRDGGAAPVSSSTTRWTTLPPSRARRTCTASCRARPMPSRPVSACCRP